MYVISENTSKSQERESALLEKESRGVVSTRGGNIENRTQVLPLEEGKIF